jgi:hypothetical protein
MSTALHIPEATFVCLREHLLPSSVFDEEAAFLFVSGRALDPGQFDFIEWWPIPPEGFVHRSGYYLELADDTRGKVIKRAHDLNASIVEAHSHPLQDHAEFSPSDRSGLREFVPHVWWRLKGRPYFAIVVAPTGFDALCWCENPQQPQPLDAIDTGRERLRPTGLSLISWREFDEFRPL